MKHCLFPRSCHTLIFLLSMHLTVLAAEKRVYIAPDDHTDYMWSGDEEDYRRAFVEMLDYYLDQMDATDGDPSEFQSRFNCDGHLWVQVYEKEKSTAEFNRLIDRIRSGHLSVPLNCLVPVYGGAPLEGIIRGMLYAGQLEREHNIRLPLAVAMENQTLPYGLGAIFAGAGARYSWRGICGCETKVSNAGDREHDIYWWGGPDGSRILMKWNTLHGSNQSIGGYAEARTPSAVVDFVSADSDFIARYPYDVIGAFGYGWDDLKSFTSDFITTAQNKTTASRKVIVSNEQDFFEDFESNYGSSIPTVSASFGNEWELALASIAEISASVKRAVEKLRTAEAIASYVTLYQPNFMDASKALRENAWMRMGLFWDHSLTADSPVISRSVRAAWQREIAAEITSYAVTLENSAAQALGNLIDRRGISECYYVFNPLSWNRTDYADLPSNPGGAFHVVDVSSGDEVPSQLVTIGGATRVRILASNVPSVGFRLYAVMHGAGAAYPPAVTIAGSNMENDRYKLTVASDGALTSLQDKSAGNREYVQEIDNRFVNDLGIGSGSIAVENAGPVSATLVATAGTPLAHKSSITLFRDLDRIEISNQITQNFSSTRTWGFSFNLSSPEVNHEEVGAVIRAKLTTDGGHYSPRNARYDWLTMNHFVDMRDVTGGVTISNADCHFMQIGNSSSTFLDTSTPTIHALAGGQVDGPGLGIPSQGGDSSFLQRFALRTGSGAFDSQSAFRFSLEHQNPLLARRLGNGTPVSGTSVSSVSISNPKILLWAMKPAEDGLEGQIVLRLMNTSSSAEQATIQFPSTELLSVSNATHIETETSTIPVANNEFDASLAPQEIRTYVIKLRSIPRLNAINLRPYP